MPHQLVKVSNERTVVHHGSEITHRYRYDGGTRYATPRFLRHAFDKALEDKDSKSEVEQDLDAVLKMHLSERSASVTRVTLRQNYEVARFEPLIVLAWVTEDETRRAPLQGLRLAKGAELTRVEIGVDHFMAIYDGDLHAFIEVQVPADLDYGKR